MNDDEKCDFRNFPTEPIGDGNPYHRCLYCKRSVPAINYRVHNHFWGCEWRRAVELGIALPQDGRVPEDAQLGDWSNVKNGWLDPKPSEGRMKKYRNLAVMLGGGWSYDEGSNSLKEAVERAYLQASQKTIRSVTIDRRLTCGVFHCLAMVVGYNGRVFMSRPSILQDLVWNGQLPQDPKTFVEITGKYTLPTMYHI